MDAQVKKRMIANLHAYVESGMAGMRENQQEAFRQIAAFMAMPAGQPIPYPEEMWNGNAPDDLTKKGDFFEITSATGSGKTRLMGNRILPGDRYR
jgi:hypothetical protein